MSSTSRPEIRLYRVVGLLPEGDTGEVAWESAPVDLARLLLDKGAKADSKDEDGQTPLHYAVSYEWLDLAKILLDKGANVNAKNFLDQTPLHFTTVYHYKAAAKLLLENGAQATVLRARSGARRHGAAVAGST